MAHWRTCSGSDEDAMDTVESLLHGFTIAVTLPHLALMLIGVLLGILVGVLPGLGAPNGFRCSFPLPFACRPFSPFFFLSSCHWARWSAGPSLSFFSIFR